MLKKTLIRAAVGFLIGIIMGDGIAMLTGMSGENFRPVSPSFEQLCGSVATAFILQTLISGIYGAVCYGGISIYDIERLPMAAASMLHCVMIVALFVPTSLFLGWCTTTAEFVIMAAIQVSVYFMIWLILYISYRKEVRKLNELQKNVRTDNSYKTKEDEKHEKETV